MKGCRSKILIITTLIVVSFLLILGSKEVSVFNKILEKKGEVSFGVIGDIHHNTEKLEGAIKDFHKLNRNMDALFLNGDIVDQGLDEYYQSIEEELKSDREYLPKRVVKNIGNHEFYNYEKGTNTEEESNEFIEKFLTFSEESKPYHSRFINGYNFITLGSEETYTDLIGTTAAYISKKQKEWLKEKLVENYEKDRPIFVFIHQGVGESGRNPLTEEDKKESIKDVLASYKEVIVFYSHMHQNIRTVNVSNFDGITSVHTGAIHYTAYFERGKLLRTDKEESFGLYVEVKKNKVKIVGRDFKNGDNAFEYEIN